MFEKINNKNDFLNNYLFIYIYLKKIIILKLYFPEYTLFFIYFLYN